MNADGTDEAMLHPFFSFRDCASQRFKQMARMTLPMIAVQKPMVCQNSYCTRLKTYSVVYRWAW